MNETTMADYLQLPDFPLTYPAPVSFVLRKLEMVRSELVRMINDGSALAGVVMSVNGKAPDESKNVSLAASDVPATEKVDGVDVQTTVQARLDATASDVSTVLSAVAANKDALAALTSADVKNAAVEGISTAQNKMSEEVLVSDGKNGALFTPERITLVKNEGEVVQSLSYPDHGGVIALQSDIPTTVAALSGADDYLKTADLADKETDPKWAAWRRGSNVSLGKYASAPNQDTSSGDTYQLQTAIGISAKTKANMASAFGYLAYANVENSVAFAVEPSEFYLNSKNTTLNPGSTARSLQSYLDERAMSPRWISSEDGVLTLLDSTACSVKDALAGDVVVLFPAASDAPRSFSLHFVAGDALSFTWPANVSFRKSFGSSSFESGKGYALSFQEVGGGVFAVGRSEYGTDVSQEVQSDGAWLAAATGTTLTEATDYQEVAAASGVEQSDDTTIQTVIEAVK